MCPAPWNNDPLPEEYREREKISQITKEEREKSYVIIPKRKEAVSHPATSAPLCQECTALELSFYNPNCEECRMELRQPSTHISDVFAVLRQWVPQVQQNIDFLVSEAFRMGAHPDDRDHLTDMTLLMYVCKAGATGVGDEQVAAKVAQDLVTRGAQLDLRCRWTDMTAIHYATYFDSAKVLQVLLSTSKGQDADSRCHEFDNGTALHIAAANLSLSAAKNLLKFGADLDVCDDLARKPVECIPDPDAYQEIPESGELIRELTDILTSRSGSLAGGTLNGYSGPATYSASISISGKIALQALGLKVGDRVVLRGEDEKFGSLEYCGLTSFAPGVWVGVKLDEPHGKNDGSVQGVVYFKCQKNHGLFVPPGKISKMGRTYVSKGIKDPSITSQISNSPINKTKVVNRGRVDVSKVSSKLTNAIEEIAERKEIKEGDRVRVSCIDGARKGIKHPGVVRFVGTVDFVDDNNRWYGVELDEALGKHDGTVRGVKYFPSKADHGVFVTEANLFKDLLIGNSNSNSRSKSEVGLLRDHPRSLSSYSEREVSSSINSSVRRIPSVHKTTRPTKRSLSLRHTIGRSESINRPQSTTTKSSNMASTSTMNRSQSMRRNTPSANEWASVGAVSYNKFRKSENRQKFLEVGTTAICVHNKEMGIVRFVGRVHFASGIWVGLELRSPNGKHDGIVEEKRYFTAKTNHGVMLKPKRLSVHGINAEKLLKPEHEYPF
ncbi:CAP-Gly domain-containing linker protein 3 [Lepeophtheirus salmonis]|uniref:CAP-Gly domain-containing linker protein 3 n=1 Tax=Lepeophtheirus salmonis TaxID=72036 RepID=UPI001AEAF065|nr:CAP-Gly domain-containing linker protein 3-like [Lepeophtheirus salmonis]